jgi:peptidoglycan/LPS O-acetylase OafA/YrhL
MSSPDVRNFEIQAVRAIAVFAVVVSHFSALFVWDAERWTRFGTGLWIGVDLFYAISGYVIARGLLPKIQDQQGLVFWRELVAFWIKRFYRIAPSAWLWIVLPLLAGATFRYTDKLQLNGGNLSDVAAILFHIKNVQDFMCSQHSGLCGDFHVYWSLSLEEQFYILFPFVVLLSRRRLVPILACLIAIQFFLWRPQWGTLPAFVRTDALLFGVLLAIFESTDLYRLIEPKFANSPARYPMSVALLFGVAAFARYEITWFYTGMVAVISAVIVWLCSYNRGYFMSPSVLRRALEWFGSRSFAIYLIHMPAFWVTHEIWERVSNGATLDSTYTFKFSVTALAIIVFFAELNFRFVEEPFRKKGSGIARAFSVDPATDSKQFAAGRT